jgi:hypothetical protein
VVGVLLVTTLVGKNELKHWKKYYKFGGEDFSQSKTRTAHGSNCFGK